MDQLYDISGFPLNETFLFPNVTFDILDFVTREQDTDTGISRQPLPTVITMTLVYTVLLLTGVIGNVGTCIVISRNRYMHTATNYYLFSLAISDLLLLVMGLPQEMYQLWVPYPYIFGEVLCILRGFTAETSTNASILTITAFTVERYVAICYPLKSHTMSKLSRAVKSILAIWTVAAVCAIPLSLQFGVIYREMPDGRIVWETALCALKRPIKHAFAISTFLFFGGPMGAITLFYVKIGVRLRKSNEMVHRDSDYTHGSTRDPTSKRKSTSASSNRKGIIKMLVAVVVSFFLCWSPFHAQRLMAIYVREPTYAMKITYMVLTYISGITYYLSATINPILYQLMSLKFQQAFKDTFGPFSKCLKGDVAVASARPMDNSTEHSITASTRLMRINRGSEDRKMSSFLSSA